MALDTDWLGGFVYNPESVKKIGIFVKGDKNFV